MATRIERHYLLDIARGLAALAVVFWHYQQFYYVDPGILPEGFSREQFPLYSIFRVVYATGGFAVEFFFVLSGYIFFWLYQTPIQKNEVSPWAFFVLRFSRLYPLHFATLLFVAAFQFFSFQQSGSFIVYPENDLKHFVLNLFLISHWGLEDGWSFNAPIWSISVEVLLYLSFFVICLLGWRRSLSVALGIAIGTLVALFLKADIGWAFICFFIGGALLDVEKGLVDRSSARAQLVISGIGILIASAAFLYLYKYAFDLSKPILILIVFPCTVLSIVLLQQKFQLLGHRLCVIGDLSYSIYLLHFPLNLTIIFSDRVFDLSLNYDDLAFFGLYVFCLLTLAYLSHRFFERPMQARLRKALIKRRARTETNST